MSRTGSWLDNAVAESWFDSLKVELVDRAHYRTRTQARTAIFAWIAWYNRSRLHATRSYLPPIEWNTSTPPSTGYHRPWPHNPGVHLPGGGPVPWSSMWARSWAANPGPVLGSVVSDCGRLRRSGPPRQGTGSAGRARQGRFLPEPLAWQAVGHVGTRLR